MVIALDQSVGDGKSGLIQVIQQTPGEPDVRRRYPHSASRKSQEAAKCPRDVTYQRASNNQAQHIGFRILQLTDPGSVGLQVAQQQFAAFTPWSASPDVVKHAMCDCPRIDSHLD